MSSCSLTLERGILKMVVTGLPDGLPTIGETGF
jgi:hypothetical protein